MHSDFRQSMKSHALEKKHRSLYPIFSGASINVKSTKPLRKVRPLTLTLNHTVHSTINIQRTQVIPSPRTIFPTYEPVLTKTILPTDIIEKKERLEEPKQLAFEEDELPSFRRGSIKPTSHKSSISLSNRESTKVREAADRIMGIMATTETPKTPTEGEGQPKLYNKLTEIHNDRAIYAKVNLLRYRENVFRAASRLAKEMPPYPDWVYQNEEIQYIDVTKICVGGVLFYVFDETMSMMRGTKLARCLYEHQSDQIPFFDRDPICFNSILNFYRTGRLHVPPNTCLTFYEEELEFWGVKEDFMETCCWSDYQTFKTATITLKKYVDDMRKEQYQDVSIKSDKIVKFKQAVYAILTIGQGNVLARWFSFICGMAIVLSIFLLIFGCTENGRKTLNGSDAIFHPNQKTSDFFKYTTPSPFVKTMEVVLLGFFLAELCIRFVLCPGRLEFFSDSLNWIDVVSTVSSLLSTIYMVDMSRGIFEGYMLVLKLPRIFRLFRLTLTLRSGMEAFTLTMFASAVELKLVFFILFIMAILYGSMAFLLEAINSNQEIEASPVFLNNIFKGIFWALVTMAGVGYGDMNVLTMPGRYMVGFFTIIGGVIICQLPVPIVLKNFSVYFNQAHARMNKKCKLIVKMDDPEFICTEKIGAASLRKEGLKKFKKIFATLQ